MEAYAVDYLSSERLCSNEFNTNKQIFKMGLTTTVLCVYFALKSLALDRVRVKEAISEIAEMLGCSWITVRRAIRILKSEKVRLLYVKSGAKKGQPSVYYVLDFN